jgi:hypothetical protein
MPRIKQKDLEKYTNKDGNVIINDYITFEGNIIVNGNISCRDIYSKGNIISKGNIYGDNIYSKGDIISNGDIIGEDSIISEGSISNKGDIISKGDIKCKILYWSHFSIPKIDGTLTCDYILPQPWQKDYVEERLGIEINCCYDEVIEELKPKVKKLLKLKKWLPIERMMLESIDGKYREKL